MCVAWRYPLNVSAQPLRAAACSVQKLCCVPLAGFCGTTADPPRSSARALVWLGNAEHDGPVLHLRHHVAKLERAILQRRVVATSTRELAGSMLPCFFGGEGGVEGVALGGQVTGGGGSKAPTCCNARVVRATRVFFLGSNSASFRCALQWYRPSRLSTPAVPALVPPARTH